MIEEIRKRINKNKSGCHIGLVDDSKRIQADRIISADNAGMAIVQVIKGDSYMVALPWTSIISVTFEED